MHYIEKVYAWSLITLIPLVFLNEFVNIPAMQNATLVLLGFYIASAFLLGSNTSLYISVVSFSLGFGLVAYYDIPAKIWSAALSKNLPLVVLLICVPLLTIPLKLGGFLDEISGVINHYRTQPKKLRAVLTIIVFIMSSIANISAIRIIHPFLKDHKFSTRYFATLYTTGFAPCVAWSPYYVSVSAVLYYTNQPFLSFLPYGLFYSACLALLGILLSIYFPPEDFPGEVSSTAKPNTPFFAIIGILGLFISVIVAGKALAFSNSLLLVSFVSVIYTVVWCLLLKRKEAFLQELANYKKNALTNKSELLLFLGVGFLGVIMSQTPIKLVIKYVLTSISYFPAFLIIILIHLTIILLSSISIHQLISITALALTISPQEIGLSQMQFCVMLIGSYTLSTALSPCVPYNIMVSNLLSTSVLNITYRYNIVFGLSAVVLSALIISLIIR